MRSRPPAGHGAGMKTTANSTCAMLRSSCAMSCAASAPANSPSPRRSLNSAWGAPASTNSTPPILPPAPSAVPPPGVRLPRAATTALRRQNRCWPRCASSSRPSRLVPTASPLPKFSAAIPSPSTVPRCVAGLCAKASPRAVRARKPAALSAAGRSSNRAERDSLAAGSPQGGRGGARQIGQLWPYDASPHRWFLGQDRQPSLLEIIDDHRGGGGE